MQPKRKARRTNRMQTSPSESTGYAMGSDVKQTPQTLKSSSPPVSPPILMFPELEEWRKGKTLTQCHEYMLTNQVACDVFFTVGVNEDRYGAHKYKLLAVSDVFYIMLLGPMAEHDSTIKIPDIELGTFKAFLRYVYTEELDVTPDTVMQMMYVAKKYNVEPLLTAIVAYIDAHMSIESACVVMEQAHLFNEPMLETKALEYIEDHATSVLESKEVTALCAGCLKKVVSSDNLHVKLGVRRDLQEAERKTASAELEKSVLTGVMTWATHQCVKNKVKATGKNKRKVLGDILWEVRFSQLPPNYLVTEVSKMKILSLEERCMILEHVVAPPNKAKSKICNMKRRGPHENIRTVPRFRCTSEETCSKNDSYHAVSFTTNEDLYLHGFSLFGTSTGKTCLYKIHSQVFKDKEVICKLNTKVLDKIDDLDIWMKRKGVHRRTNEEVFRVYFQRKVLIEKNTMHTLYVDLEGPQCYTGLGGRSEVCFYSHGLVQITFHDAPDLNLTSKSQTDTVSGQIPSLLISLIPSTKQETC
ncbi:BTB/POZ domain-containing protein 6-B-like isoform X2 [Haliotis asinina]